MTAPVVPRRRPRRVPTTLAATLSLIVLAANGSTVTASTAGWSEEEWAAGTLGTVDCEPAAGVVAARGAGTMLSGELLGLDLDAAAELRGTTVTNDGTRSRVEPEAALPADLPHAYSNALEITALNEALELHLTDLSRALQLPLDNDTGVLNQYARATPEGAAGGASGLVTDSGVIATSSDGGGSPRLGTLNLKNLVAQVNPSAAAALAGVTDVSLEVGAVAGRAEVDTCSEIFSGPHGSVDRDYLLTDLDTTIESPTVGALAAAVTDAVEGVGGTLNDLLGQRSVTEEVLGGATGLLSGLLATLTGASLTLEELSVTVDTAPVEPLLTAPFGDDAGVLVVDPGAGTISVDTAGLLAQAYPETSSARLNGLPPNTDVLADPAVLAALTTALGQALDGWLGSVEAALLGALQEATVTARLELSAVLLVLPVTVLRASVVGSVADLVAGEVDADVEVIGIDGGALLDPLVSGLGTVVGHAVQGVIDDLDVLGSTASALTVPVLEAVSAVFGRLYVDGVVSLTVNAQNQPATGGAGPADWAGLPGGRYDVAALRVGVLDAAGSAGVRLYLGRGSVGPGCLAGADTEPCGSY